MLACEGVSVCEWVIMCESERVSECARGICTCIQIVFPFIKLARANHRGDS